MTIPAFRKLPKEQRKRIIRQVDDPLARRVLTVAFLHFGRRSWVKVALMVGGGNTPNTVCQIAHRALFGFDEHGKPVTFAPENRATIDTTHEQEGEQWQIKAWTTADSEQQDW